MNRRVLNRTQDGSFYYGSQPGKDGSLNGTGIKKERDGSYYIGEWKNNLRDGYGAVFGVDGQVYIGFWEADQPVGIFACVYAPDSPYVLFKGQFDKNMFNEGTAFFADGRIYHGLFTEWRGSEFDGEGALMFRDGRIYAGRWKSGGTDVGGVLRRKNGKTAGTLMNTRPGYEAKSWENDTEKRFFYGKTTDEGIRNAEGILFFSDDSVFVGAFRGGQKTGEGIIQDIDGTIRIGDWNNNHQSGRGIALHKSDRELSLYIGEFLNDLYSGDGTMMIYKNGSWSLLYDGAWERGKYSGRGLLDIGDNKYYVGGFLDGLQNGEGELVDENGDTTSSTWKMGAPTIDLKNVTEAGPERTVYDADTKVPVVVFNSLKQRGEFGEQRFFVGIRSEEDVNYRRSIQMEPGFEYEVRIAYCNNADASLPESESSAKGTKLQVFFDNSVGPTKKAYVSASISAENAKPAMVWDAVSLQADENLPITYKIASAKIWNNQRCNGKILPQTLFTDTGVKLGGDELNGIVQAGEYSSGYVTFVLKTGGTCKREKHPVQEKRVLQPDSSNTSEVSHGGVKKRRSRVSIKVVFPDGKDDYSKEMFASMGQEIPLKILFTNSASSQNVHIRVALPSSLEYVANSGLMKGTGLTRSDLSDSWIRDGILIGSFAGDGEGEINFRTRFFPTSQGNNAPSKILAEIETPVITMKSEATISEST